MTRPHPIPARVRIVPVLVCFALVAVSALAAVPPASAQGGHDHDDAEGGLHLHAAIDTRDRARVGEVVPFTYYILDDAGELVGHVDTDVTVTQNGRLVAFFETPHEHDGVYHVEMRFTRPGPFTVKVVTNPYDEDAEPMTATYEATVAAADAVGAAELEVDGPEQAWTGTPAEFTVRARWLDDGHDHGDGDDGSAAASAARTAAASPSEAEGHDHDLVHHADVRVRVYRIEDDKLVQRVPLHLHGGEGTFRVNPQVPGDYRVQVELYPWDPEHTVFQPVVAERALTVRAGASPGTPDQVYVPNPPGDPGRTHHLRVSVDPTTMVGPMTDLRFNALYLDHDGTPVPHVDFEVRLTDPSGRTVLSTSNAHGHHGLMEALAHTPVPGEYELRVTADPAKDDSYPTETAVATYTVQPPVYAHESLPGTIRLLGADELTTEEPRQLTLEFTDAAGRPVEHVEADLELYREGDPAPIWTTKLHSHAKDVVLEAAFLEPGRHYLKVNPSPQSPTAQVYFTPAGPGEDLGFPLDVAGDPVPLPDLGAAPTGDDTAGATLPGPGALVASLVLAAAAGLLAWRRRTG